MDFIQQKPLSDGDFLIHIGCTHSLNHLDDHLCVSLTRGSRLLFGDLQQLVGQLGCEVCPEGRFAPDQGFLKCQSCEPGRYADGSQKATIECEVCHVGSEQEDAGQSACVLCPAGRSKPEEDIQHCLPFVSRSCHYFR